MPLMMYHLLKTTSYVDKVHHRSLMESMKNQVHKGFLDCSYHVSKNDSCSAAILVPQIIHLSPYSPLMINMLGRQVEYIA